MFNCLIHVEAKTIYIIIRFYDFFASSIILT